jgi:Fe2+ or Zn2+ uptake regulation protein
MLSLAELHTNIPEVDFSTIFRNVEQLCADGLVKKVVTNKDTVLYELTKHAHDHFICTDCGVVEEVHLTEKITAPKHATITEVLIKGVCVDCQK